MPRLILNFTAQVFLDKVTSSRNTTPLGATSPYTWDKFDPWFRDRSTAGQDFLEIIH